MAPLRDRVAYHAVCNICAPVFERYQIDQSCACRKGKGQSEAIRLASAYTRSNSWYLKLDVRKYFDSVSHDVLKRLLSRLFKDRRLLDLLGSLIDSYHTEPGRGIPIGSLTSQFFANHYLGILDHHIKEELRCRAYVRYMDDFILWDNGKETLQSCLEKIDRFLTEKLRLTLKPPALNKTRIGLSFLGYRLFPGHLRLARRSRARLRNRYRKAFRLFERGVWDESAFAPHGTPFRVCRAGGIGTVPPSCALSKGLNRSGSNRVNRGGSWNNNARNCRSANRNNNGPTNRNNNLGLRPSEARRCSERYRRTGSDPVPAARGETVFPPSGPVAQDGERPAGPFHSNGISPADGFGVLRRF